MPRPKKDPYVCQKCARVFTRKSAFDDHSNKKVDCSTTTDIQKIVIPIVEDAVKRIMKVQEPENNMQKFFEDLHQLLWGRAGLSSEKAVDHMIFFFTFRLLEPHADDLAFQKECRWSHIVNLPTASETASEVKKACNSFRRNLKTKSFFNVLEIADEQVIYDVVHHINNRIQIHQLTDKDTLGSLFEYLLSRGMSTMSDDGQYFTNREICQKAFDLAYQIKKTVRRSDGTLCTFADWFCGTGGFISQYIHGVSEHTVVDWTKEIGSIYAQDMNQASIRTTMLNMLILTGSLATSKHIRSSNSFADPIFMGEDAPFKDVSIDYCFMNPPYGGDKTKGKEYRFKYSTKKTKGEPTEYHVNKEIQSIGIEDDDKVSAGVQLGMASLAHEGVCCIVLPQGFFFGASKKCVDLRKKIVEEYKIWYVVDIASGAFSNTGTKTSMVVFQKGVGPTEKVSFIGIDDKLLGEATLEELKSKKYSLNFKQYLSQSVSEVEGFEMMKLEDILDKKSSGKTKVAEISNSGKYPFFSCKIDNPCGTHSSFDHEESEYLLFAKGGGNAKQPIGESLGIGRFYYMTEKSASTSHVSKFVLKNNSNSLLKYISLVLKTKLYNIQALAKYTTGLGHIVIDQMMNEIQIPIPSIERQQQIVDAIDGWTQLAKYEEESLKMLEKQMMFAIKEMGCGKDRIKLGDVCDINSGETFRKEDIVLGNNPVIGGGKIVGYHNKSNRPGNEFCITRVGDCNLNWFNNPYMLTEHGYSITIKKDKENSILNTIFYHLINIKEELQLQYDGTAQKLITKSKLRDFMIPSFNMEQQTLQPDFDEIRHKHEKIAIYKLKAQDAIQRLIPQTI